MSLQKASATKFWMIFCLAIFSFGLNGVAQVAATWSGVLDVGGIKLRLVFHIDKEGDTYTTKMDSPDQQAFGIPISNTEVKGDSLFISEPKMQLVYKALIEKDTLQGVLIQGGNTIPSKLYRGSVPATQASAPKKQTPKAPFSYTSDTLTFYNSKDATTHVGILTKPKTKGSYPLLVLISGSGAQDYNSTILGHQPFWVIADSLAKAGIAVFRYADRGMAGSEGSVDEATTDMLSEDAAAAIRMLRSRKEPWTAVGIAGHSQGGIIGIHLAATQPKLADFLILMASPGVSGSEIILQQYQDINKDKLPHEAIQAAVAHSRNLHELVLRAKDSTHLATLLQQEAARQYQTLDTLSRKNTTEALIFEQLNETMNNVVFKDFVKFDPRTLLPQVKCDVLVLQGMLDMQVAANTNVDAITKSLQAINSRKVAVKKYPYLNHLFQYAVNGHPEEYANLEETFNLEALSDIILFIKQHKKK